MSMRKTLKWTVRFFLAAIAIVAALAAHTWWGKPFKIDWFYDRVFLQIALDNPELLTRLRLLEQIGLRGHNAQLADVSQAADARRHAKLESDVATFKRYDATGFTGQDRISYDVFDYFTQMQLRGHRWRFHNLPISQHFGMQSTLPSLLVQAQQVNDVKDAEHFIARLNAFSTKFDQTLDGIKERERLGILPQRFVVDKVVTQMREFVAKGARDNPMTIAFAEKLAKIESMSSKERDSWQQGAENAVKANVLPAYQRAIDYFESLKAKVNANNGVWAWPNGTEFYQYCIEDQTTSKFTADEIHTMGLADVERLSKEMDETLRRAGHSEGSIAARIQKIASSPEQLYPDNDAGRAQILADYQKIIDEISVALDPYFSLRPKAAVEVKRVEKFAENETAAAYYEQPPLDGSRPGTFYANLRDVKETPKFSMRTLAYHEAIPGHHFQIAIAQELKGLPIFRTIIPFTAYAEGWALYTERLAWEIGFQKQPLDNLGRLRDEMLRAVRLVVDTGIHHKRWTREQAIAYMMEKTGMAEGETITEIERYFVDPGQALAYKVGMNKILELRERAKSKLGAKFDIRDFHSVVLKNGALPLTLLERVVDEMIADKLAKS
jgi:uncharacterized protein (DUF885 family)